MASPLQFDIAHKFGREEAKQRVEQGLPKLSRHIPAGGTVTSTWPQPYEVELLIAVMGQSVTASLAIEETVVHVKVKVPLMLSMMSGMIGDIVRKSAEEMLNAPKPGAAIPPARD